MKCSSEVEIYEFILAFSCRGRLFCPSCRNKKVVQFGHQLKETVLYHVPHRQYVFSVPEILRRFFFYAELAGTAVRRELTNRIC